LKSPGRARGFCLEVKENWGKWQGREIYLRLCGECKDENFCREMGERILKAPSPYPLPRGGEGRKRKRGE